MPVNETQPLPQFHTAEFEGQSSGYSCSICNKPIAGNFYRIVNGEKACWSCSQRVLSVQPRDTHAAFSRAVVYGLGGALLGLILYSAVGILLHLEIGYVSLAVGFLVGRAMMMGSGNIGGRRYQWTAVALTYAAVSLSAIPIAIAPYLGEHPAAAQVRQANPGSQSNAADASMLATGAHKAMPPDWGKAIGTLLVLGLASPLLEFGGNPVGGLIGLIILLVGVRIAWRLTAGSPLPALEGPC